MKDVYTFKVLWVDDEEKIVESTKLDADEYGIELDHYSNWQEAEVALKRNFDDYSAIIFDAYCKLTPSGDTEDIFIGSLLPDLRQIFEAKKKYIPWYILSAGTMDYFSQTIKIAKKHHQSSDWGQLLYKKDVPDDDPNNSSILFNNIIRVAQERSNNIVLYRHKDTFSYLNKDYFVHDDARKKMLKMLGSLYSPEENFNFEYEGNPLRKVVEYLFHGAKNKGLLPNECFHKNGSVNLTYAQLFMKGVDVYYDKKNKNNFVRWGDMGQAIFPEMISIIIDNILDFTNEDSHADITEKWRFEEDKKDIFYGFLLQMCHVIKSYGEFVDEHPNTDDNYKMIRRDHSSIANNSSNNAMNIPSKNSIIGKPYLVRSENGILCCGNYKLDESISAKENQIVTIKDLDENEGEDKFKYPYIIVSIF